jgi:hypothetical protein
LGWYDAEATPTGAGQEEGGVSQLFPVEQSERTSDDYLTPRWVFDTLGLTFDLDVAAPPWDTHVPARRKYTKADDGLTAPWEGRVWMNPPYSKPRPWVEKFRSHGHGIALVHVTIGRWLQPLWVEADGALLLSPPVVFELYVDQPSPSGEIAWPLMAFAFGPECVEAIGRLGRVR